MKKNKPGYIIDKPVPVRMPMIHSLMKFNGRVLLQGDYPNHSIEQVPLEKIKESLFFNSVYLSNTAEMFAKYPKRIDDIVRSTHSHALEIIEGRLINIKQDLHDWYGIDAHDADIDELMKIVDAHIPVKRKEEQHFNPSRPVDIMKHDQLIEYPLDSFDDYLSFLTAAANNKDTIEIDICLYRIGKDPAIFDIISDAVSKGIKVHINIELRASGEDINYEWMKRFQDIGCLVTAYGYGKLKVHCKLTLVKFLNGKSIAQIGTGNYHTKTTTQYTDLSLVTADDDICHQVDKVFSILKGKKVKDTVFTSKLLVTRYNAREKLVKLIRSQAHPDGYICFKCNALDDDEIINELNKALLKGCSIDLIIRGVCTWIPDTANRDITVKSIVWDKLEHSRVYCFGKVNPKVYMGSLDLVTHKLDRRIETLVKICDLKVMLQIVQYLNRYITTSIGYVMDPYGNYFKEGQYGLPSTNDDMVEPGH